MLELSPPQLAVPLAGGRERPDPPWREPEPCGRQVERKRVLPVCGEELGGGEAAGEGAREDLVLGSHRGEDDVPGGGRYRRSLTSAGWWEARACVGLFIRLSVVAWRSAALFIMSYT
jgi:hypothetical protein